MATIINWINLSHSRELYPEPCIIGIDTLELIQAMIIT